MHFILCAKWVILSDIIMLLLAITCTLPTRIMEVSVNSFCYSMMDLDRSVSFSQNIHCLDW